VDEGMGVVMSESKLLDFESMKQQVFLELLRSYHNGLGEKHASAPIDELVVILHRESKEIVSLYFSCSGGGE
jgi:hypothetical protein